MQLKKVLSFAVAAAMAAAFCAPAMAATPGEAAVDTAQTVLDLTQNNWATNATPAKEAMSSLTDAVTQNSDITVSQEMNDAGVSFFDIAENVKDTDTFKKVEVPAADNGLQVLYRADANSNDLTIKNVSLEEDGSILFEAEQDGADSEYGYAVTIMLPSESTSYFYSVTMVDGNQLVNITAPVTQYADADMNVHKMVTFWVPHFTTYELTPVNITAPTPTPGGNNNEQDNAASSESTESSQSAESSESTAAPATVAENPIKKTGTDMNLSLVVVVALTAAAACGAGVALKMSRKGE